ncbi:MAG: hypothetical protein IPN01_36250 [Deltaproteobacteria bacterium]|nr:hypothetical protein [Deltaproteobacteria bacterium]
MDLLNTMRHRQDPRQLGDQRLVVAGEDVVDQLGQRALVPAHGVSAPADLFGVDLLQKRLRIDAPRGAGLSQRSRSAAAEVDLPTLKHGDGAGMGGDELTDAERS